jgi:hypothetical protein
MGVTQAPDPIQEPDYADGTIASPLGEVKSIAPTIGRFGRYGVEQMTVTAKYLSQHSELATLIRGITPLPYRRIAIAVAKSPSHQ